MTPDEVLREAGIEITRKRWDDVLVIGVRPDGGHSMLWSEGFQQRSDAGEAIQTAQEATRLARTRQRRKE